jgi:3-oxoacyl-[acyl-carrier-protein] synthase-3
MGASIEAVATSHPRGLRRSMGARHLSDEAARSALARGHHYAGELDLIVNVGLYKDHGLAEPALASIIQEDVGANPGHPPRPNAHGTFSFDLLAGGCGVLAAAHLVDGFVGGDDAAAHLGLVVAADADPSPKTTRGFPFAPAGGALLLGRGTPDRGFQRFRFESFPCDAGMFEVMMRWDPRAGRLRRGRNVLEVREAPAFAGRCIEHGTAVARRLLEDAELSIRDIDLLVASPYPRSFATGVASALGLAPDRLPALPAAFERAHTAGPLAALEAAGPLHGPEGRMGQTLLFVTAGAGIEIAAAIYRA